MAPRTRALPKKRSPVVEKENLEENQDPHMMSPISKKSKAELRRQSVSRAKEWASDRKRKKNGNIVDEDDDTKKSKPDSSDADEGEEADVVEKLPSITTRKSTRRRGTSKAVAAALDTATELDDDESSISPPTRRSSRRRTMTVKATDAPPPTTRRSRRKKPEIKIEEPELKPEEEEEEVEVQDDKADVVEEEISEKDEAEMDEVVQEERGVNLEEEEMSNVKEEEEMVTIEEEVAGIKSPKAENPKEEVEKPEMKEEVVGSSEENSSMDLLELCPVLFQALVSLWTLAFAIMMMFCLDWWTLELGPNNEEEDIVANQRDFCGILGLWLVTIVVNFVVFGAQSQAGWILTGTTLAMASFSSKLIASENGATAIPSLPIYTISGFDVNVLDSLVVLCLVGYAAVLLQPVENPQVATQKSLKEEKSDPQAAPCQEKEAGAPKANGPRAFIGERVAVEKGIDTLSGTVKDYDSTTREWLIQYDVSQEEEEFNRVQLGSAFKLYAKDLSDSLKAM
eukprot:CAMPEP_0181113310 /NCGR_PEP_ID=MMETSP1071-20121207/20279_1 /TAXON_ID=35127 /ORGANISM="Thalassiosira sp., Strain NH16" /LENGTH=510 /DNA_ID=CAMNT_0023197339 /DNA_START=86 /DNA_END=1618 /DNA_ORIENTATION=-